MSRKCGLLSGTHGGVPFGAGMQRQDGLLRYGGRFTSIVAGMGQKEKAHRGAVGFFGSFYSLLTTRYSLRSTFCPYGFTSELECEPFATDATQTGCEEVGNGVSATPVSWPVLGLSWPAEIELSR